MTEKSKFLQVDRAALWTMEQVRGPIDRSQFERVWENPLAQRILRIDFAQVALLPLVEGGIAPADLTQQQLEESLKKKLADYEKDGFVLLDGSVVATLLGNPQAIPPSWATLTDADSMDSAIIRFDGSVFRANGKPEDLVLAPFFERGSWSFGFGPRFPRLEDQPARSRTHLKREFTAVLKIV